MTPSGEARGEGARPSGVVGPVDPFRLFVDHEPVEPGESAVSGEPGKPGEPAGRRSDVRSDGDSPWWRYGFPASLVASILLIPVLLFSGARVLLDSDSGRLISTVTDASAPGWQAAVEPTPTLAALSLDSHDALASVTVLALTGDGRGGMIQMPGATSAGKGAATADTLAARYAKGGVEGLEGGLEDILGISIGDVSVIGHDEWVSLVGPVAPIALSNPDPVSAMDAAGKPELVFPKGSIDLRADQVWEYLSTRSVDEAASNLMVRHEAFWRGWLAAVAKSGDVQGAVPGEIDSGLGMFVRTLSSEQVDNEVLPVSVLPGAEPGAEVFVPDPDAVGALVARIVPFPTGPEGRRAHVEVFDGTGRLDHGAAIAEALGVAGVQVDKIGNATTFDVETTRIVYFSDEMTDTAERLRDVLGFGELVRSDELNSAVDVSIVLGADALDAGPADTAPTISVIRSDTTSSQKGRTGG